jgi:F-type H+-transporting ATPase subunit b
VNINATLIGQTITFFVFVWFCMKFIWPPVVEAMRARQRAIAQVAKELNAAKEEGARIIEQARQRATQMIEEAQAAAREEGERLKASAQEEISQEMNRAREALRGQVARLAVSGAERILETSIDESAHTRMLERLAAEL